MDSATDDSPVDGTNTVVAPSNEEITVVSNGTTTTAAAAPTTSDNNYCAGASYEAGDLILTSKPWACVVSDSYIKSLCHSCCARLTQPRKICSSCHRAYYCSKQCQMQAWKVEGHKFECYCLQKWDSSPKLNMPSEAVRFTARILFNLSMMKQHAESPDMSQPRGTRTFDDLISHWASRKRKPQERAAVTQLQSQLLFFLPNTTEHGFDQLRQQYVQDIEKLGEIYGKWQTNAMTVDDYELFQPCGMVLYLEASRFDHACYPNACIVNRPFSNVIELRALEHIKSIQDVRICYLAGGLQFRDDRRRDLHEHYQFWCECCACNLQQEEIKVKKREDSMRAMRCTKCTNDNNDTSGFIPIRAAMNNTLTGKVSPSKPSFACGECGYEGTVNEAKRADNAVKECLRFIDSCSRGEHMQIPKFALLREMLRKTLATHNFYYTAAITTYLEQELSKINSGASTASSSSSMKDSLVIAEAAVDALQAPKNFLHPNHFYLAVKYIQFLRFLCNSPLLATTSTNAIENISVEGDATKCSDVYCCCDDAPSNNNNGTTNLEKRFAVRVEAVQNAYKNAHDECRRILLFYKLLSSSEHASTDDSKNYFERQISKFVFSSTK